MTTTIRKLTCALAIAIPLCAPVVRAQDQSASPPPTGSNPSASGSGPSASGSGPLNKGIDYFFNYLNMAGTNTAAQFKPMTFHQRARLYGKTMVNPIGYLKVGFSAGINQWEDKPPEWGQGASGYGKRFGDIFGQYTIQRTVTFGLSSALHEDNRYFNSGKTAFWPRIGYAVSSGILARHDDGSRHISISQLGGVAAGAFISRLWQPPSQSSAGNGAVSFGITMASNMGFSIAKEFIPDLGRAIAKKRKKPPASLPAATK